jgi:2-dehydro-3-deoxy-D-arabinonate dehydratase
MTVAAVRQGYNLVRFSPKTEPKTKLVGISQKGKIINLSSQPNRLRTEDILFDGDPVQNISRLIVDGGQSLVDFEREQVRILRPMTRPVVWGAGVTYENSMFMREVESGQPGFYGKVYVAPRPELFEKGRTGDVTSVGPNGKLYIPGKSKITLTEAELVFVIGPDKQIVGYTIGNDFTATDIEAENPLYLPQAKIFKGCFSFGPTILVGMTEEQIRNENIKVTVVRENGETAFSANTSIGKMKRTFTELVDWLFDDGRGELFTNGVLLSSGTGVVMKNPDIDGDPVIRGEKIPHMDRDRVDIHVPAIGTLKNRVAKFTGSASV